MSQRVNKIVEDDNPRNRRAELAIRDCTVRGEPNALTVRGVGKVTSTGNRIHAGSRRIEIIHARKERSKA